VGSVLSGEDGGGEPSDEFDPWAAVLERIDDAASLAGLDPNVHILLRAPERLLEVAIPVRMDDGHVEVFKGWRVHHDTSRGPAKGGIRFHPQLHAEEVAALAARIGRAGTPLPIESGRANPDS